MRRTLAVLSAVLGAYLTALIAPEVWAAYRDADSPAILYRLTIESGLLVALPLVAAVLLWRRR